MPVYEAKTTLSGTTGTVTTEKVVTGLLTAIKFTISAGTPTIAITETGKMGRTLLSKASLTTGLHYPSVQLEDNTGTTVTAYVIPAISGEYLLATISSGSNGSTITIEYQTVE